MSFSNPFGVIFQIASNPLTFPLVLPILPIILPISLINNMFAQSLASQSNVGFLATLKLDGSQPTSYSVTSNITLEGIGWPATGSGSAVFNITNPDGSKGGNINITSNGGLIPFNINLQPGTILSVNVTSNFPTGTVLTLYG